MTKISALQDNPFYKPFVVGFGSYQNNFYNIYSSLTAEYVVVSK